MKKQILALLIIFLSGITGTILLAGDGEVTLKEIKPFTYVAMDFSGPFDQMTQHVTTFMAEFFKQKLKPLDVLMGVYYNSPERVKPEDLRWSLAFAVAADSNVAAPLKKLEFNHAKTAVYLYTGPYEKMNTAFEKITRDLAAMGYEMGMPVYERYLNNPMQAKPEDLKTEIIVPLTPARAVK